MSIRTDTETGFVIGDPDRPLVPTGTWVHGDAALTPERLTARLDSLILSASGWRGVFAADGDEESFTQEVAGPDLILVTLAARVFAEWTSSRGLTRTERPEILLGTDARPTGARMAEAAARAFIDLDVRVRYLFICAAPQIMAYSAGGEHHAVHDPGDRPFFYISASHNPVGHNGLKLGSGGGVMGGDENHRLIARLREFADDDRMIAWAEQLLSRPEPELADVFATVDDERAASRTVYARFLDRVVAGDGPSAHQALSALKAGLAERTPGIIAELNGSARGASIDVDWLSAAGCRVRALNAGPREIVHRIVPEGESLSLCCAELQTLAAADPAYIMGYVPDNDGDRGNLVYLDDAGRAQPIEAQSVFALACVAELAWLEASGRTNERVAVVVNGPTSMRVDRIAKAFGAEVHRAEVGEANVVGLARRLRDTGYTVRILGEGSNGGNITHPSAVRDPMATVMSVLKLLTPAGSGGQRTPREIWLERRGDIDTLGRVESIAAMLATLPEFTTTSAYEPEAKLQITTRDHAALKAKVEQLFADDWEALHNQAHEQLGVDAYRIINHEGLRTFPGPGNRSGAETGGLKFELLRDDRPVAFMWMRGSGTEPVFRVLVDVEGSNMMAHDLLLGRLRELITLADRACSR